MKNLIFALLSIFSVGCLFSCSEKEEPVPPAPVPHNRFWGITDGATLSNIDISYKKASEWNGVGFKDFHLFINPKFQILPETLEAVEKLEDEYLYNRYTFIREGNNKTGKNLPSYFAAYVNGEVKITCDKKLFGKEPGEVLNEFFTFNRNYSTDFTCLTVGIDEPYFLYGFKDEQPTDMEQIFTQEAWISHHPYSWAMKEVPKEKYPRVTFYLTFPVKKELTGEYARALYDGEEPERTFTEEVFTSECSVTLKW